MGVMTPQNFYRSISSSLRIDPFFNVGVDRIIATISTDRSRAENALLNIKLVWLVVKERLERCQKSARENVHQRAQRVEAWRRCCLHYEKLLKEKFFHLSKKRSTLVQKTNQPRKQEKDLE